MEIKLPEMSLVLLIGTSGSGKTTFGTTHFDKHEVISSDKCRGIVSNNENNLKATGDAFELLHFIVEKRLKRGLLTVVDATNVQASSRKSLIQLARRMHVLPTAIVLNLPEKICLQRNEKRNDRNFGKHVIRNQNQDLRKSLRHLKREGFRKIYVLNSEEEVLSVSSIVREKLYNNKEDINGPFDIIGDIHGCYTESIELLEKLGYVINTAPICEGNYGLDISHPEGRRVIFLGDLVDRGPNSPAVLKLVMSMVNAGIAFCVPGNHDIKLHKKLNGKNVQLKHGLAETMAQLEHESEDFKKEVIAFLYSLVSHYVFDNGRLVVAHAGLKEEMQGRGSGAVRSFCLFGETSGEIDEFGLPVRYNWAAEYKGKAKVIYGHTPIPKPQWLNNTINIDTGCVFGGKLTALRYPEEEIIQVDAKKIYYAQSNPLERSETILNHQQENDDLLNIDDVIGKRIIQTRLRNNITIKQENSISALEVMSRFAVNPKWLIYLPPTMSPCETSELPNFLEHPKEAIDYYKKRGVRKVVCEEKHMGSRVVLVLCKDEGVALKRFGIQGEGIGICYTRTGRNFFHDPVLEKAFLYKIRDCLNQTNFWEKLKTDWVCLDCELMPWSAKAQSLLKDQYAAVGAAAQNALPNVENALKSLFDRGIEGAENLLTGIVQKKTALNNFVKAYRNYCWEVNAVEDYKLAPFHILATEGQIYENKSHEWHMETIATFCNDNSMIVKTNYKIVDTEKEGAIDEAISWWLSMTDSGGEGMVVKPFDFLAFEKGKLLQPAVKCRGSEYLRIIYGPEYNQAKHLKRLKKRGLSRKRSLALREFALGIEGLDRFVKKEPLRRVHETVFGVLALESEEVDPRL